MSFIGIANNIWRNTRGTGGGNRPVPLLLPGLINWTDFADVTTLFQTEDTSTPVTTNGQFIGRASDKSGANNHVIQITALLRPVFTTGVQNGLSGSTHDTSVAAQKLNTLDTMSLGGTTASIFMVIKGTTPVANARAASWLANGQANDFNNPGSAILLNYPTTTSASGFRNSTSLSTGTVTDNTFFQLGSIFDGTNHTLYINNVAQTAVGNTDTFSNTGTLSWGGRPGSNTDGFTGVICEAVMTNTALNSSFRNMLAAYFTAKWAV